MVGDSVSLRIPPAICFRASHRGQSRSGACAIRRSRLRHSMITRSISPAPSRSVNQACLFIGFLCTLATTCSAPAPYLGGSPFSR